MEFGEGKIEMDSEGTPKTINREGTDTCIDTAATVWVGQDGGVGSSQKKVSLDRGDSEIDYPKDFQQTDLRTPDGKPTEVFDFDLIHCADRTGKQRKPVDGKVGKWMIFEPAFMINDTWSQIKKATEAGELGHYSMVSTMKDKGQQTNSSNVVCTRLNSNN